MRETARRDHRVRRARALHRPAGAHVLGRDVHAARLRRRRAPERRASSCSTRSSPSATRPSSASASRKIFEFKQRGGTIVFVSHAASAVERLCERAVLLKQGQRRVRRRVARGVCGATRACSPRRRRPPSGRPACGSGAPARLRVTEARLEDADGEPSGTSSSPDEPIVAAHRRGLRQRRWRAARSPSSSAARTARLLGVSEQSTAELGWDASPGERAAAFRAASACRSSTGASSSRVVDLGRRAASASTTASSGRRSSSSSPSGGRARLGSASTAAGSSRTRRVEVR